MYPGVGQLCGCILRIATLDDVIVSPGTVRQVMVTDDPGLRTSAAHFLLY